MNEAVIEPPKTTDTLIQVRVPADLKRRTSELFESLGTNTSAVVKMMLVQADRIQNIPFKVRSDSYPITANEVIEETKATFALEGMPLTKDDIIELQEIELARISPEQARAKIIESIKKEE